MKSGTFVHRRKVRKIKDASIKSLKRSIRKIQGAQELKAIDIRYTTGGIDQDGEFTLLNGVAQGVTDITRIGNEIQMTSVQFRGVVTNSFADLSSKIFRMLIFIDRQANAGTPTVATLLDLTVFSTAGDQVYAPYNHDYQKRYKILYDRTHTLTPQTLLDFDPATGTTDFTNPVLKFVQKKINARRTVKYAATGASAAAIETNSLWAFLLTNSSTNCSATIMFRTYFKE